jgi:ribosomal protein L16 Arg81 hydroxylase
MSTTTFELTDSWRRWLAENQLLGTSETAIIDILMSQGLPESVARAELDAVRLDDNLVPARWVVQRLRKLESLLESQQRMHRLDPAYAEVPRRSGLTSDQFLREHYAANRPVLLPDVADRWAALQSWTGDYLIEHVGNEVVEVMTGREGDEHYEENLDAHRTSMVFRDYVGRVETSSPTNDIYLVANNHFFERPGAGALLSDISQDERILDPGSAQSQMFFWYGPAGTVTPLHHDTSNVLLTQVRGSKRVRLVPALESHKVYNEVAVYSRVDAEAPDLDQFPLFAGVTSLTVDLGAGDALFVPVGWWHHVRSLEVSISVSFTNFRFPNAFDWSFPNIDRS